MKSLLVLTLLISSTSVFAQASGQGKAVYEALPKSAQAHDAKKKKVVKAEEAPCDTKEDALKKLEEKKKESAATGKGFSLQGSTDSGCTLK